MMKGFQVSIPSVVLVWFTCFSWISQAQERLLFQTGFESTEGYTDRLELIGQNGWTGQGTGGNGLELEAFSGRGYQAYVGYYPPTDTNDFTSVWKPLNIAADDALKGILKFSVTMQIVPSTNSHDDDFRWSVYNTNGNRLFSLDFETSTRNISYALDDGRFVFTNLRFEFDGQYDLVLFLNFASNHWTALLNDALVVNSKPITTKNAPLSLGDIDAVWEVRTPLSPGNNFMLFDDYRVAQMATTSIAPFLETIRLQSDGQFFLRINGEGGVKYDVDVTEDFTHWFNVGGFTMPSGGSVDFQDATAPGHARGFYRVLQTP